MIFRVLYRYSTWSRTLREEYCLKLSESRELLEDIWTYGGRGDKEVEETAQGELPDLYSSSNICRATNSRIIKWAVM
jgi:hypothetical protein